MRYNKDKRVSYLVDITGFVGEIFVELTVATDSSFNAIGGLELVV
jgi:hypothetical protein